MHAALSVVVTQLEQTSALQSPSNPPRLHAVFVPVQAGVPASVPESTVTPLSAALSFFASGVPSLPSLGGVFASPEPASVAPSWPLGASVLAASGWAPPSCVPVSAGGTPVSDVPVSLDTVPSFEVPLSFDAAASFFEPLSFFAPVSAPGGASVAPSAPERFVVPLPEHAATSRVVKARLPTARRQAIFMDTTLRAVRPGGNHAGQPCEGGLLPAQ